MSAARSRQFRTAARLVLEWCAVYTRGLQPAVATARQDEIASDLHEHAEWASTAGWSARRLAWSVARRAALGIGADLAWRRLQQRAGDPQLAFGLRASAALLAAVLSTGVALTAIGVFAIVRVIRALQIGDLGYVPTAVFPIAFLDAVALIGTMLIVSRRTRVLGTVLLTVPAVLLFQFVGSILWRVSASTVVAFNSAPWWATAAWVAGAGLAVFLFAAAAFWWSTDRRSSSADRKEATHV